MTPRFTVTLTEAEEIGNRMREARGDRTQGEVAARCHPPMATTQYARIERGEDMPQIPTLRRIAQALGVPFGRLIGR